MPFRAEKAGNRPKAAIKRTRRPNCTTPIFSMSDREQNFYRFLQNPPPLRGVGRPLEPLGVDTRSHLLAARWSERSHALSYLLHVEFAVGVLKQAAKVEGTSLVRKRIFNIPALRSQTIERFEH